MIDCNCHLVFDSLWANRVSIWQRARVAGLSSAVVSAEQITPQRIQQLQDCEQAGLFPAIGWHPLFPRPVEAIEQLDQVLSRRPRWGVGEVGIDTRTLPRDGQADFLSAQLSLAQGRWAVLHAAGPGALDTAFEVARRSQNVRGMVHAFAGSVQQAKRWLDLGWYLSVGGPITWPQSRRLAEWVAYVPIDRLLLETDAPDLSVAKQPGEPADLVQIADKVADLRGVGLADVQQQVMQNACQWLGADRASVIAQGFE